MLLIKQKRKIDSGKKRFFGCEVHKIRDNSVTILVFAVKRIRSFLVFLLIIIFLNVAYLSCFCLLLFPFPFLLLLGLLLLSGFVVVVFKKFSKTISGSNELGGRVTAAIDGRTARAEYINIRNSISDGAESPQQKVYCNMDIGGSP